MTPLARKGRRTAAVLIALGHCLALAATVQASTESFDTGVPTGWTLDAPINGVGWAVDGTPATVIPGIGIARSGTSLNYNNGTSYDGGTTSGSATSPSISLSGLTNPVLKFWDLYQTETRGTATDKRFLEIWNAAGTTRLAQWQLASVGYSFGGGSAYQAAGPGPCGETHLDLETGTAPSAWHQHKVYLDPAWGSVKIKFVFNSVDAQRNGYAGWGVDDLEVASNLTPVPTKWTDLWPWSFPPQPSIPTGSKLESFLFGSNDSLQWGWSIFAGSLSLNIGITPLIVGEPGPPDPTDGAQAQLGSSFVIRDPVHGHRHVTQMVDFALWQDQPGTGLVKVRRGARRGYCIAGETNQGLPENPTCENPTATYQVLAGNSSYAAGTPEQELNVAGLPRNTEYYLIGINDPLNRIRETNNTNQHDNVRFILPTKAGERSKALSRTNPYPPSGAALTITAATLGTRNGARALKVTGTGFDTLMTAVLYDQGTTAMEQPFYTIVSSTEMWVPVPTTIKFPVSLDLIRASGHIATTRLAAPNPSILPTDFIWDDDNAGGTSGNNNKQLNRGETVGLTIRLGNAGAQPVRGVTGTLSFIAPDSNLTLAQPTVTYGDLNPNSESNGSSQYRLVVSATAPLPRAIPLQLTIQDASGASWVSPVHVIIQLLPDTTAPTITITAPTNNFTIPPGTTALTIAATASDPAGAGQVVSGTWGVQFKADGVVVPISLTPSVLEDFTPPYGAIWNLTGVKSGPHILTAIARDAAGNTTTSAPITVTIPSDTTPPVISNLTISSLTSTSITVTWQTNEPTNSFLCIQDGCSGSNTPVTSHTRSSSNLTPNTFYQFWVTATDLLGNTTTTPKQSFVTPALPSSDTTPPSTPANATGTAVSFYEIRLDWSAATDNVGVVGYRISRQIGTAPSVLIDATSGITYRDLAVSPGTTYTYAIRAYDAAGNVSGPATATTTTPTPDPAKLFARTWGHNTNGQLGDNTTTSHSAPTTLVLEDVTALTSGFSHVLALRADGTIWAWGRNQSGQLGNGTTIQRLAPVAVMGLPTLLPAAPGVIPIAAGAAHSLALAADGTVWRWGAYSNNGTPIAGLPDSSVPAKVSGLTSVMALASGGNHSLALQSDGTLWSWGANLYGQLGDGTNTSRAAPVRVQGFPAGVKVAAIAAGERHSIALLEDGTVWAWGNNTNGQLGDNTTANKSKPTQVRGPGNVGVLADITAIASGSNSYHTLALKRDGTVWAWGRNLFGQLGDTTTTQRLTPVQVTGLSGVRAIAAGGSHSLTALADGTVWAWGNNSNGQLGNPVVVNHLQPVPVADLSSVSAVVAGGNSSYSLSVPSALLPSVTFASATTSLGERTGTIAIPVTLSAPYASPITVDYAATGGTATGGRVDYTLFPGTLTFAPNQTTATIELVLIDDTLVEPDETIEITLSSPSNAILGSPSTHTLTLLDNDTLTVPVLTSPTSGSGTVGQVFSYQITATNNPTSFGATGLPTGLMVNPTTGLIAGTPTAAGTTTVTLSATNAAGTGTRTLTLTIVVGNRAPVATSGVVTTPEDTPLGLTLDASDPDTDPLTYTLVTLPAHGTLSGTAPALTYLPALNYAGADSFTFKANDGQLDSQVATISLTITPVNDAPVATHTAPHLYLLNEDDPGSLIDLTIFDVDTPLSNLTLSARTSNPTLVPLANIQFSGSGTARFAQITLAPNQSGTADVTLLVSDGEGEDGHGFNLIVSPVNDPPTLAALSPQTIAEGQPLALTLQGSDVDGDPVTYSLTPLPPGASLHATTGVFAWTPSFTQAGTYALTATVSDGTLSASQPLTLTVTEVNTAPVAEAQTLTLAEDTLLAVTLSATDPEGEPLTYTLVEAPSHGTLTGTGASRIYTPTTDYHGADSFTFTATDGSLTSATATVSIIVTAVNDPPVLATIGPKNVTQGHLLTITASATDVDNDPLTYTTSALPSGATFNATTRTLSWTPDSTQASQSPYSVTFTVSDGKGGTAGETVSITVTEWLIETVAGGGSDPSDGILATSASIPPPPDVAVDAGGNLYIAGGTQPIVRKVVKSSGRIYTVAGNGTAGFSGDGGPATQAQLSSVHGVAVDQAGNLYIADTGNHRIRKVDPSGTISTVAGNGTRGFSGDGVPATNTGLADPLGVDVDAAGNIYIADTRNFRIRKVDPSGIITTIAGNGLPSGSDPTGIGGPATAASLFSAQGVTVDDNGHVYIADDYWVLKVDAATQIITEVAGFNIGGGFAGDGGLATAARIDSTYGVAVDKEGNISIADQWNHRVRNVDTKGIITTFAGSGSTLRQGHPGSFCGDGGPPTSACFALPTNICIDSDGAFYVADTGNARIRRIVSTTTQAPEITTPPANQTVTAGQTARFSVVATGTAPLSYQWQKNGVNIAGATSASYTTPATVIADSGAAYRVTASNAVGSVTSNPATLTVNPAPPVITSATTASGTVGQAFSYQITATNSPTSFGASGLPAGLSLNPATGLISGTPTSAGTATVTLSATNPGGTGTQVLTLTISPPPNQPPVAQSQILTTAEDTPRALTLSGTDPEGQPLTFAIVTLPAHGTLTGTGASRTYTPAADYAGADHFTFTATDGSLTSHVATVALTITLVNDAPVATAQTVTTPEDTPLPLTLSGTDVEGEALTYTLVAAPSHGTLSGSAPSLTYTPAANYAGPDACTFTVSDGSLTSAPATVSLTITPVNDPPLLTSPATCTPTPAFVQQPVTCGVSASDIEGDALSYAWSWGDGSTATGSSVTHAYTGAGSYTVAVTISDGQGGSVQDSTPLTIQPLGPDTTPPVTPITLHAVAIGPTRVVLAWDATSDPLITGEATSGLAGYHLIRDGQAGTLLTSVTTTDHGLSPQTSYTYQVEAIDRAGNRSPRSPPLPLTTAILGDLDGDAAVRLTDLRVLTQMLIGQRAPDLLHADLDGDGRLGLGDMRALVGLLANR